MINFNLLRGHIYSLYSSQNALTQELGWPKNKIGRILNGSAVPNVNDCEMLTEKLKLTAEEYISIFIPSLSPNGDKIVIINKNDKKEWN
ncbi:MAG: hypothetical protein N4A63_13405 [Vallitalea sp.]|jgi:hypothetical protein|nr:hypothetical protein [Vallitalea sp.]